MLPNQQSNRPSGQLISEINTVPYIDVMLVLLVIFIITAPFLKSAVDIELPETDAVNRKDEPRRPLVVTINSQGEFFLNVGENPEQALALNELIDNLKKIRNTRKDFEVLVHGDAKVSYGVVADFISHLQAADIRKATLVTRPRPSSRR